MTDDDLLEILEILTVEKLPDLSKYFQKEIYDSNSSNYENNYCSNCLNNPKNGGSGICHCTLGLNIRY